MAYLLTFSLSLLFFHTSEFFLALLFHGPSKVSTRSFLVSKPYVVAMVSGIIEYAIEGFLLPELKSKAWVSYIGLSLVILGEMIRKTAIITAQKNFTHDIKLYHDESHKLVVHGVYGFVRHPSYLGFFIWSVGTQILLMNPICSIGYALVTWRFFADRVKYEEYFLYQFFGKQYADYANRVWSGIPFVR